MFLEESKNSSVATLMQLSARAAVVVNAGVRVVSAALIMYVVSAGRSAVFVITF